MADCIDTAQFFWGPEFPPQLLVPGHKQKIKRADSAGSSKEVLLAAAGQSAGSFWLAERRSLWLSKVPALLGPTSGSFRRQITLTINSWSALSLISILYDFK